MSAFHTRIHIYIWYVIVVLFQNLHISSYRHVFYKMSSSLAQIARSIVVFCYRISVLLSLCFGY